MSYNNRNPIEALKQQENDVAHPNNHKNYTNPYLCNPF
jgi:hypothetical protein